MSSTSEGNTSWVMIAGAMVMFMAPGVGLFYGGMVNKKNVLSTIAYCFLVFSAGSLTWALLAFSLAFGNRTVADGFIGDCTYCGLRNIVDHPENPYCPNLPFSTFFFFQMMFAAITPALFVGSIVGRIRILFLLLLSIGFIIIVYSPLAYWIWNKDGWLYKMGAIDFAGGLVIHVSAGFAGLASAVYLGYGEKKPPKQNSASISMTLIGTAILWFGWFGFNGGSALIAGLNSTVAIINTHLAACIAGLVWALLQYLLTDQSSILGWCSGAICGLAAITPAAGYVNLWASIVIGAIAAALAYLFCYFKSRRFEELADTLDVFACHGISGGWGSIAAGIFATTDSGNTVNGLFYGNARQFGVQVLGVVVCAAYSFILTLTLYFLLGRLIEPKVTEI